PAVPREDGPICGHYRDADASRLEVPRQDLAGLRGAYQEDRVATVEPGPKLVDQSFGPVLAGHQLRLDAALTERLGCLRPEGGDVAAGEPPGVEAGHLEPFAECPYPVDAGEHDPSKPVERSDRRVERPPVLGRLDFDGGECDGLGPVGFEEPGEPGRLVAGPRDEDAAALQGAAPHVACPVRT